TLEDIRYIETEFRTLEQLCAGRAERPQDLAGLIETGHLPRPAYVLPDGRAMFPRDLLALYDDARGATEVRARFAVRYTAAAAALGEAVTPAKIEEEWQGYLGGLFRGGFRAGPPGNIYRNERPGARGPAGELLPKGAPGRAAPRPARRSVPGGSGVAGAAARRGGGARRPGTAVRRLGPRALRRARLARSPDRRAPPALSGRLRWIGDVVA